MPSSQRWYSLGILLAALVALCLHAWYYYPFIADDALISLRYADRFLEGKGLTWTDGRPVEGYSNFLWIMLVAGLGYLEVDLIDATRILGGLGMATVLVLLYRWWARDPARYEGLLGLTITLFFFAGSGSIATWTVGGLETPLVAALLALTAAPAADLITRVQPRASSLAWLSLWLGLLCITRPDGPLFCVAAAVAVLVGRYGRDSWRQHLLRTMAMAIAPLLFYGGQLAFRLSYYGEWFPNTAYVKVAPSLIHFVTGAIYDFLALWGMFPISFLLLWYLIHQIRHRALPQELLPMVFFLGFWLVYLAFVGGDIFSGYRLGVPITVLLSFILPYATVWLGNQISPSERIHGSQGKVAMIFFGSLFFLIQGTHYNFTYTKTELWEWDAQVLSNTILSSIGPASPTVASIAAGSLPYWTNLPAIDIHGLNDYDLPRKYRPSNFGLGYIGHEIGSPEYIMMRAPDIVFLYNRKDDLTHALGQKFGQDPQFPIEYQQVHLLGTTPYEATFYLWFRLHSPKIGISQTDSSWHIPAYLLSDHPETLAYLSPDSNLVINVAPTVPALLHLDSLRAEAWTLHWDSPFPAALSGQLLPDSTGLTIRIEARQDSAVPLRSVTLRRKGE